MVFLHGGPGAGCSGDHRRFFDPAHYRVLLFDQRGAGRSRPYAETRDNTTQHLIADIEALRRMVGVDRWQVFGGSWGSTLALAYAQAHPDAVSALALRGVFLGRRAEIEWFLFGMRKIFPEAWEDFMGYLPEDERDRPLEAYGKRLADPNPKVHLPAAQHWASYEGRCVTLLPNPATVRAMGAGPGALSLARLEAHYFAHGCFLEEGELLSKAGRLKGIPGVIVQGRYDIVCPPESAHALAEAWPEGELVMVPDAGHSAMEPGIARALVQATESLKGGRAAAQ